MANLGSVDNKIQWADYHIQQLDVQIRWFERSKPYEIVTQPDTEVPGGIQKVFREYKPLPAFIPLRIGDVAHNLRSALDQLAWIAVGASATENTAFPIWRKATAPTPAQYKSLVLGKVKGAGKEFIKAVLSLEPYEGGAHELIWTVDYLNIVDKHRLPIAAYVNGVGLAITATFGDMKIAPVRFRAKGPPAEPLKDGDVLYSEGPRPDRPTDFPLKNEAEPFVEIALNEPSILVGQPPLKALTELSQAVNGVVNQLRSLV